MTHYDSSLWIGGEVTRTVFGSRLGVGLGTSQSRAAVQCRVLKTFSSRRQTVFLKTAQTQTTF